MTTDRNFRTWTYNQKIPFRIWIIACLAIFIALPACNSVKDPSSKQVLFEQIEGVVQDIEANVSSKHYSGDLGEDRLGPLFTSFQKAMEGTPQMDEVNQLTKKLTEVSTLASKRPKMDVLRKSVKEFSEAVAELKKKL